MDNTATDAPQDGQPLGLGLSELLGPLPKPTVSTAYHQDGWGIPAYTAEETRAYAAEQVAAERKRCANVVRYWLAGYAPETGTHEARCVAHVLDGRPAPEGPNDEAERETTA